MEPLTYIDCGIEAGVYHNSSFSYKWGSGSGTFLYINLFLNERPTIAIQRMYFLADLLQTFKERCCHNDYENTSHDEEIKIEFEFLKSETPVGRIIFEEMLVSRHLNVEEIMEKMVQFLTPFDDDDDTRLDNISIECWKEEVYDEPMSIYSWVD